jgi:hypothetical protein
MPNDVAKDMAKCGRRYGNICEKMRIRKEKSTEGSRSTCTYERS